MRLIQFHKSCFLVFARSMKKRRTVNGSEHSLNEVAGESDPSRGVQIGSSSLKAPSFLDQRCVYTLRQQ